jgi:DNA modification methylase
MYPRRQGQKSIDGQPYDRAQKISDKTNGAYKNDVIQNKLEYELNNDLEGNVLGKAIFEKGCKVEPCYEFLRDKMIIDLGGKYGFTQGLKDGKYSVAEVNRFIDQRHSLENGHKHTFVIPGKCTSYKMDCVRLAELAVYRQKIQLIITSIPYWDLRSYQPGDVRELGQEETKEEYAHNIAQIFKKLVPTLSETVNVFINVGETYKDGVGQGIPYLIKEYVSRETPLIYKDTLIWTKKNPRPQGEKVKRPVNCTEFVLWFVLAPSKAKYIPLSFSVEGKEPKVTLGAKDVSSDGRVSKKRKSISKPYGKIMSHLKEQEIENIILTSVGKNHDIFRISEIGHPAPMSPMLPVTLILMCSDEHELVCDPFSGANVVGKVAIELNRHFVSTEIVKNFFDIGCEMLKKGDENFDRESLDEINKMVYPDPQKDQEDLLREAA